MAERERKESDSSFILDLYYWAYIILGFLYVHFELILLSLWNILYHGCDIVVYNKKYTFGFLPISDINIPKSVEFPER